VNRPQPGDIVIVDWRDAKPKEPNKRRPAVVVDGDALYADTYPNVLLVPLTTDHAFAIDDLSVRINPHPDNGCAKPCWALAFAITTTSLQRIERTTSRINCKELTEIRRCIAFAVGAS
jgi:mRNA interferase MazF